MATRQQPRPPARSRCRKTAPRAFFGPGRAHPSGSPPSPPPRGGRAVVRPWRGAEGTVGRRDAKRRSGKRPAAGGGGGWPPAHRPATVRRRGPNGPPPPPPAEQIVGGGGRAADHHGMMGVSLLLGSISPLPAAATTVALPPLWEATEPPMDAAGAPTRGCAARQSGTGPVRRQPAAPEWVHPRGGAGERRCGRRRRPLASAAPSAAENRVNFKPIETNKK